MYTEQATPTETQHTTIYSCMEATPKNERKINKTRKDEQDILKE